MGNQKQLSKRRHKLIQCGIKIRYNSKREANKVFERMLVNLPTKDTLRLNVYKCPHCYTFHIGNKQK